MLAAAACYVLCKTSVVQRLLQLHVVKLLVADLLHQCLHIEKLTRQVLLFCLPGLVFVYLLDGSALLLLDSVCTSCMLGLAAETPAYI